MKPKSPELTSQELQKETEKVMLQKRVAFNDSWRSTYRKKAMAILKEELNANETLKWRVFQNELNLASTERASIINDMGRVASVLASTGDNTNSEIIKNIAKIAASDKTAKIKELENLLKFHPEGPYNQLGYFLLGSEYEKKGFHPEALGYFSRIAREKKEGFIVSAALFEKAKILFYQGKLDEAKRLFQTNLQAGFPGSAVWLANTLLVKGETEEAWKLYSENAKGAEYSDSLNRLSLGDMYIIKGHFDEARTIFENMRFKYAKSEFLSRLFALKIGDAYLAEGRINEAVAVYTKVKQNEKLKGEEWAMAGFSLADALTLNSDIDSLTKAEDIYERITEGDYAGTEIANIGLVLTRMKLGKFNEALADMAAFDKRYPTSPIRATLRSITYDLVFQWTESLYNAGDYYGVIKVMNIFGESIPFGKKGETYLRSGKAYVALGLFAEAVSSFDNAIKISSGNTAEEAMFSLGKVYIAQRDFEATERLYRNFAARFPKSAHLPEVNEIFIRIAYMRGENRKVAESKALLSDPEDMMVKASSFVKLGRLKDALSIYEKAGKTFEDGGNFERCVNAYLKMADLDFELKNYDKAIAGYRKAASLIKEEKSQDKSWAIYRIAQSYSKLNKKDENKGAVEELKALNNEYGNWAGPIFKESANNL
ncbi:MAG: tetratricopeptide repeat protein [Deltaproteobacteria bacterium]|nr:tetratricopeptide repeat protein [Deltaproteobacteria bacterium]